MKLEIGYIGKVWNWPKSQPPQTKGYLTTKTSNFEVFLRTQHKFTQLANRHLPNPLLKAYAQSAYGWDQISEKCNRHLPTPFLKSYMQRHMDEIRYRKSAIDQRANRDNRFVRVSNKSSVQKWFKVSPSRLKEKWSTHFQPLFSLGETMLTGRIDAQRNKLR